MYVLTGEEVQYLDKSVSCAWNTYVTQLYSLLQDDSEAALPQYQDARLL
jgi:hypothetical protein